MQPTVAQIHKLVRATMSLYSSEVHTKAIKGESDLGAEQHSASETLLSPMDSSSPWYYLSIHHKKVEPIDESLKKHFNTFIHKSVVYKKTKSKVIKKEKQTISGLLFIQGDKHAIQTFLKDFWPGISLVKDCASGDTAQIADTAMRPFMRMSQVEPTRIRFMPNPIGHYAEGNPLLRITSGPLAGMEGYKIRISRDKCFVTTLGGITVAIGGVHRETFENLPEELGERL